MFQCMQLKSSKRSCGQLAIILKPEYLNNNKVS